jgi:hypothetical protein
MKRGAISAFARASLPILLRMDPEAAHELGLAGLQWLKPFWPVFDSPPQLSVRFETLHIRSVLRQALKERDFWMRWVRWVSRAAELGIVTPRVRNRVRAHGCSGLWIAALSSTA